MAADSSILPRFGLRLPGGDRRRTAGLGPAAAGHHRLCNGRHPDQPAHAGAFGRRCPYARTLRRNWSHPADVLHRLGIFGEGFAARQMGGAHRRSAGASVVDRNQRGCWIAPRLDYRPGNRRGRNNLRRQHDGSHPPAARPRHVAHGGRARHGGHHAGRRCSCGDPARAGAGIGAPRVQPALGVGDAISGAPRWYSGRRSLSPARWCRLSCGTLPGRSAANFSLS